MTNDADISAITSILRSALDAAGISVDDTFVDMMHQEYRKEIERLKYAGKQRSGTHAEINIADAWEAVFAQLPVAVTRQQSEYFACIYTVLFSRPYAMPGMSNMLTALSDRNIPLGIVSNAQSFTMALVNYFATQQDIETTGWGMFDPKLSSLSFEKGVVKPDERMFKPLTKELSSRQIVAQDCLFVGNDMYRDIYPAHKAGFKTVLFVGDRDSLRMRDSHKAVIGLRPDYIINSLEQLLSIID